MMKTVAGKRGLSLFGCRNGWMSAKSFGIGYNRMITEIEPVTVVFNGPKPDVELEGPPRIYYDSRTGDKSRSDQMQLFREVY